MKAREVAELLLKNPDANVVILDADNGFICVTGIAETDNDPHGGPYVALAIDSTVAVIQPARLIGR